MGEAPHMMEPQQLYLAHLAPYLAETQRGLEEEMRLLQVENQELSKGN